MALSRVLISINASLDANAAARRVLKTYTFYLRDGVEPSRFEPAMFTTDAEATAHARELLQGDPECEAVDVFFGQGLIVRVVASRDR